MRAPDPPHQFLKRTCSPRAGVNSSTNFALVIRVVAPGLAQLEGLQSCRDAGITRARVDELHALQRLVPVLRKGEKRVKLPDEADAVGA